MEEYTTLYVSNREEWRRWLDSIIKRFDDEKYIQKFTPRKEKSSWSALNEGKKLGLK